MTQRTAILEEPKPAPTWMADYLKRLAGIARHTRPIEIVLAPQAFFDNMPRAGAAEGALMMLDGGTDVIIMPERAVDTEYWRDIIAHEFAHALHSTIDRMCNGGRIDALAYEDEVEHFARLVGGLLQFASLYARFGPDIVYLRFPPESTEGNT